MNGDFSHLFGGDTAELFRRLHQITNVDCADLSTREKLDVLSAAWLATAANARTEALAEPGGFPAERDRQIARLGFYAEMIAVDEPDLEAERLFQEGDYKAMFQHQQHQIRQAAQELEDALNNDETPRDDQAKG